MTAINRGTPIVMIQRNLPMSQAMYNLARLILRRATAQKEPAVPDKAASRRR